jgi:hypothetical protein
LSSGLENLLGVNGRVVAAPAEPVELAPRAFSSSSSLPISVASRAFCVSRSASSRRVVSSTASVASE